GRNGNLDPRRMHVVGLRRVLVQLRRADTAAVRHANGDREVDSTAGPPAVAPDVGDQLVEARIREGVVLHLADGSQSGEAEADGGTEPPRFGERRIDASLGPEALLQPSGRS